MDIIQESLEHPGLIVSVGLFCIGAFIGACCMSAYMTAMFSP